DEGDGLRVRRPDRVLLAGALTLGDEAGVAVLDGHAHQLATGLDENALPGGAEGDGVEGARHADAAGAGVDAVRRQAKGEVAGLAGGDVVERKVVAMLHDDALAVGARPLHVEVAEAGAADSLAGAGV